MSLDIEKLTVPLKISKRIQETDDAVSLVLEIPKEQASRFNYQAGQFVTFFMQIGSETISRSYSLSSAPSVDHEFKITVKKVPGGRGSTHLCDHTKVGDTLRTTPPAGQFYRPQESADGTHLFLFAAGSGITPIYSILKETLAKSALNRVTLVYCNRTEGSIIYKNELIEYARSHARQLQLIHVLSKPDSTWAGQTGRLGVTHLDEILTLDSQATGKNRQFYLCGPTDFMNGIRDHLVARKIAPDSIRIEDFGAATHAPKTSTNPNWTLIGPGQTDMEVEKIIATVQGKTYEVKSDGHQSILESLLAAGIDAPYSCMDGACMACMAKVVEGQVYQEDPGILADENIKNHEALTCQAKPLSRIVKVSFDGL